MAGEKDKLAQALALMQEMIRAELKLTAEQVEKEMEEQLREAIARIHAEGRARMRRRKHEVIEETIGMMQTVKIKLMMERIVKGEKA